MARATHLLMLWSACGGSGGGSEDSGSSAATCLVRPSSPLRLPDCRLVTSRPQYAIHCPGRAKSLATSRDAKATELTGPTPGIARKRPATDAIGERSATRAISASSSSSCFFRAVTLADSDLAAQGNSRMRWSSAVIARPTARRALCLNLHRRTDTVLPVVVRSAAWLLCNGKVTGIFPRPSQSAQADFVPF